MNKNKNKFRYVEAHQIKNRCDFLEKSEIEKHMKLKEDNFELKSENMIKQQNLEKRALAQKMNSEYDEMNKIKQVELEKIITKYKNKKYELETKQGKEKNLHGNNNMLKASLFNNNLTNLTNYDGMLSMNKSVNKSSIKPNPLSENNLRDISALSNKRPETAKSNNFNMGLGSKKPTGKSNISFNISKNNINTNKSLKMFSSATNLKDKYNTIGTRNLEFSSNMK